MIKLHKIISVTASVDYGTFIAHVDLTDVTGQRYEADYVSREGDDNGLAPTIRAAINQWIADGNPVLPYVEPEPVPETISRRQFYQGLAVTEKITQAEALAAIKTGVVPAALQVMLDQMADEDARFEADMLLSGAADFNRDHPLVMVIAITQGMTETEVDQFWHGCSVL